MRARSDEALAAPAAAVVPVRAVAVSPDKLTVAAARGNQLHLYDAKTGNHTKTFADPAVKAAHVSLIESMAYSPDGKTLATGSFREVVLWDTAAGTVRKRLTGFAHTVTALAFSADGKRLATGGGAPTEDGEVKLFDPASGALILETTTNLSPVAVWQPWTGPLATNNGTVTASTPPVEGQRFFRLKR